MLFYSYFKSLVGKEVSHIHYGSINPTVVERSPLSRDLSAQERYSLRNTLLLVFVEQIL